MFYDIAAIFTIYNLPRFLGNFPNRIGCKMVCKQFKSRLNMRQSIFTKFYTVLATVVKIYLSNINSAKYRLGIIVSTHTRVLYGSGCARPQCNDSASNQTRNSIKTWLKIFNPKSDSNPTHFNAKTTKKPPMQNHQYIWRKLIHILRKLRSSGLKLRL